MTMKTKGRPAGRMDTRTLELYPTPELRKKHRAFLVHQCQARFRNEPHDLTEQQYFEVWGDQWDQRGRRGDQLTMTRIDPDGAWTLDNVEIVTRKEQLQRNLAFSGSWGVNN